MSNADGKDLNMKRSHKICGLGWRATRIPTTSSKQSSMQERKDCLKIIISKNRNWTTQSTKGDPRPGTAKHALQARKEALKKEQAAAAASGTM